jgi:hypothetical protein
MAAYKELYTSPLCHMKTSWPFPLFAIIPILSDMAVCSQLSILGSDFETDGVFFVYASI